MQHTNRRRLPLDSFLYWNKTSVSSTRVFHVVPEKTEFRHILKYLFNFLCRMISFIPEIIHIVIGEINSFLFQLCWYQSLLLLFQGYDNTESSVRKASVFCLVAIYSVIGEELKPYLAQLTGSKVFQTTQLKRHPTRRDDSPQKY